MKNGSMILWLQAELMYPHIATTDAKASTNATWLRGINEGNYHFKQWHDAKACKAIFGLKGERAIFNGDALPAPAGRAGPCTCISPAFAPASAWPLTLHQSCPCTCISPALASAAALPLHISPALAPASVLPLHPHQSCSRTCISPALHAMIMMPWLAILSAPHLWDAKPCP